MRKQRTMNAADRAFLRRLDKEAGFGPSRPLNKREKQRLKAGLLPIPRPRKA
jgi:hypothetical protein